MYNIPLFDLNFGEEEEQAVLETLKSKWISMGPKCTQLEKKFAELFQRRNLRRCSMCDMPVQLLTVRLHCIWPA